MNQDIQNIINLLNNSISENRDSATLAYAQILSNYTDNNEVNGILTKSLIKVGCFRSAEYFFQKTSTDVTNNIHIAEAYFDYLCLTLNFEEAFLHAWNCINTKHLSKSLSYIENTLKLLDGGKVKYGRTKEFIEAKAALACQLEIPLKDKIFLSFSGINYELETCTTLTTSNNPRIFFDITTLLRMIASNKNPTGIQRFLCEIIHATHEQHSNCYVYFVIPHYSSALTMHASDFLDIINSNTSDIEFEQILTGNYIALKKREVKKFNATDNDSIILADAFWHISTLPHIISQIDSVKCKKFLLVHDLIPITLNFEPAEKEIFESSLLSLLDNCDTIITNSYFTKSQVDHFLEHKGFTHKCIALPFAAQKPTIFSAFSKNEDSFSDFVKMKKIRNTNFILTVSSVSNRKRILELATSFYKLISTDSVNLQLVIVGQDASGSTNIGEELQKVCSQSNGNIIWLQNVGDTTLHELYESCMFFVYPSSYEGWGLPIGEALAYGKVPIVHAVTSIPEVGKEYAVYCDLNHESIAASIVKLTENKDVLKSYEEKISNSNLRVWADVARDMIGIVL